MKPPYTIALRKEANMHIERLASRGKYLALRDLHAELADHLEDLNTEWEVSPAELARQFGVSQRRIKDVYGALVKAGVTHGGRLKEIPR
jgi:hypothetical protein